MIICSVRDPKPRRTGAWLRKDGIDWFYTATPERYNIDVEYKVWDLPEQFDLKFVI